MARTGYPSDKQDQFMLRLPDGMRDRLKEAALESNRSMNAELVDRLQRTLEVDRIYTNADDLISDVKTRSRRDIRFRKVGDILARARKDTNDGFAGEEQALEDADVIDILVEEMESIRSKLDYLIQKVDEKDVGS